MVRTCICIGSIIWCGISMIDFSKDEYDAVCRMRDRLSLICVTRYSCKECPLNERGRGLCTATLLDMNIMDFEYRHKNKESRN